MKPIFIARPRRWWLLAVVIALALMAVLLTLTPTSGEDNDAESWTDIQQSQM